VSTGARFVLTDAQREQIERGRFVRVGPAFGGFLVGRVGTSWRAYRNECQHRALPLDLGGTSPTSDDGRYLLCNQHGALYRLDDGRCVAGPCAGESLSVVGVREDGDALEIG
jgi:nitrite reductase/ring-hydroxylating ferredoxin subunit